MSKKAILALTGPKITDGRRCKPHNHNDAPLPMYITGIPKAWGLGTFPDINQFFTICLDNFRHF